MKRFAKTPAIIAGILGCISIVASLISMLTVPMSQLQGLNLVSILFNVVAVALCTIALFRGKKDVLAGIFFCVQALAALIPIFLGIPSLGARMGRMYWFYYGNFENLLLVAAFAFLALDCFLNLKMPANTKAVILVVAVALHFLLDVVTYGYYLGCAMLSYIRPELLLLHLDSPLLRQLPPVLMGYLIGVLPATAFRILTAVAAKGVPVEIPEHTGEKTVRPPEYHKQYDPQPAAPAGPNWYGYLQPGQPGYEQYCQSKAPAAPQPQVQAQPRTVLSPASDPKSQGYIGLGGHIALCLLTFGIWPLIWICKTTNTLNQAPGMPQQSAAGQLLLCMFVPFYTIFWYFNKGKRVDAWSRSKGLSCDCATLCLITGIFIPIVAMIVIQDKINRAAQA